MQTATNGTIIENGSSSNGALPLANGCETVVEKDDETRTHKKKAPHLSQADTDIIRLIGQHLREMGFQ